MDHPGLETFRTSDPTRDLVHLQQRVAALTEMSHRLRCSDEKYRALLDSTTTGFVVLDTQGRVEDANDVYVGFTGHQHIEEIRNRSVIEWTAPADRDRNQAEVERCVRDGHVHSVLVRYLHADGSTPWLEIHATVMTTPDGPRILALCRDVTAEKMNQATLESIFRAAPVGIGLVVNRVLRQVNARICEMTGYSAHELIGQSARIFYPSEEEFIRVGREKYGKIREHGTGSLETVWQRKDGRCLDVLLSSTPLEQGHLEAGVTFTVLDITARKQAEAAKLEMERRLLHAQKLESIGVLAGGIAHDFNNLLTGIQGNLELALMDLPSQGPPHGFVMDALRAAKRAADLTRQLLAYSGRGRFQVQPMDLNALVRDNANLLRTSITGGRCLRMELHPDLPLIQADPGQMQQVAMNLITNAADALGETEGLITISTGVEEVSAEQMHACLVEPRPPAGRYVFLSVTDTGCGMDQETLQRLFEPFYTTKFTGRGLGMSAVLGIVRGHHGAIFIQSAPGCGTAVRVLFPVLEVILRNGLAKMMEPTSVTE